MRVTNRTQVVNSTEVEAFYRGLNSAIKEKRSLTNGEKTIPVEVMDRILFQIGDFTNLYNEVDVVQLESAGRAILDGTIPEAIWTEMTGALESIELGVNLLEVDGFKLGGFIAVPNSILDDTLVKLAVYVEQRLAQAIAKALDKAILNGTGAADKQPEGIIPAIPEDHKVTVDGSLSSVLSSIALVDSEDSETGEIIAVMKRSTYYGWILPQTIATTTDGRQVVQGANKPNIAGFRVVFSQNAPVDGVVLGDFKQYLLSERAHVEILSSDQYKFIEDQTVFKGEARYDGKPKKPTAFALLTLKKAEVTPPVTEPTTTTTTPKA